MPTRLTETTCPWVFDTKTGVVYGLTTAAWYTVPDIVRRRGTRALLKTACGVAGLAVLLRTDEGRQAIEAVRSLRDAVRDATSEIDGADRSPVWDDPVRDATQGLDIDEVPDDTVHSLTSIEISPAGKAVIVSGAAVVLGVTTMFAVFGEKAAYRWGERMRARGVRAPHLRVGLTIGAATVLLGGLDLWTDDEADAPAH
ncbi:hypothetical protein [Oerskovia jenensis]|uniref:Uncharacterized protein n=1 Tax=Oerskovia jenensis TaxID=162169 RepID=A0ABS2LAX5_9CELL|nr:hypothetical protein [Oerskovia jenensis]MBM7477583.1 hypothetical protein [Oerskovia jenensis]